MQALLALTSRLDVARAIGLALGVNVLLGNFGFYTSIWDRLFRSLDPTYVATFGRPPEIDQNRTRTPIETS